MPYMSFKIYKYVVYKYTLYGDAVWIAANL